ncbi:hypothetical protein BC938DRAFT_472912 [Jimgerdemannia flammicorona]|uniref:Uncharacterized protein n=1 Tax=Jimgerdemannia flammicorona TaxID=994334 RepID=A0A433Q559_9FUNG|nr:hypothetical protein BC938DRAFT_472912 [Jimgerdemannia flammicorona]
MASPNPTTVPSSPANHTPDSNWSSPDPAASQDTQDTLPRRSSTSPAPTAPSIVHLQQVAAAKLPGKATAPTTPTGKHLPSVTPPINVFSNDGSFLERFKKMKQDDAERMKREEAMQSEGVYNPSIAPLSRPSTWPMLVLWTDVDFWD